MKLQAAIVKSLQTFKTSMPILLGVLLLINLASPLLQAGYSKLFTGNMLLDPLLGAAAGSISFGIPITSYIVGGELLKQGVSLVAVTAFIIAWTTVGVVMLPLEASMLGKRFAISRNLVNFIFSIVIATITVAAIELIQ